MPANRMERLIHYALLYPGRIVALWLAVLLLALPSFWQVEQVLEGGNGSVTGSESQQVTQWLQERFHYPFAHFYIMTASSSRYPVEHPVFQKNAQELITLLQHQANTRLVSSWYDTHDPAMVSTDHHHTWIVVGQQPQSENEIQAHIPLLRHRITTQQTKWQNRDPTFICHHTGMDSLNHDVIKTTLESTTRAERQVLFLTLPVLLLAFGSAVALWLPILMAVLANILSLALLTVIGKWLSISVYAQSITTMLSLALGIDYALLMVWRWRESEHLAPLDRFRPLAYAAKALLLAGFTFGVGLSGLWLAPLMPLYSIGAGGFIVILVNVALGLTLIPALLRLCHPILDFPAPLSKRLFRLKPAAYWGRLCQHIMHKPWQFMLGTGLFLGLATLPAWQLHIGEMDLLNLPEHLEAKQGMDALRKMSSPGIIAPLHVVIQRDDGQVLYHPTDLKQVRAFHTQLLRHPAVAAVQGLSGLPWDENPALERQLNWLQWAVPEALQMFISQDQKLLLLQVIPRQLEPFDTVTNLVRELRQHPPKALTDHGLSLKVGGPGGLILDFNDAAFAAIPRMIPVVLGLTYMVLFIALRSWLLPAKAILLNLGSVALSYSALVVVFQWGILPGIAPSPVMAYVPILLFCIIFGMSIDYEVFLLTRIKEAYQQGHSNAAATVQGIQGTGDVITYAALLMCLVFGAFMLVEMSIIKQLGLGLTVAILADATLIRMVMVPALMRIAGKWNWVPGERKSRTE